MATSTAAAVCEALQAETDAGAAGAAAEPATLRGRLVRGQQEFRWPTQLS